MGVEKGSAQLLDGIVDGDAAMASDEFVLSVLGDALEDGDSTVVELRNLDVEGQRPIESGQAKKAERGKNRESLRSILKRSGCDNVREVRARHVSDIEPGFGSTWTAGSTEIGDDSNVFGRHCGDQCCRIASGA